MPRATWFCIDIEASGPIPHLYDMLSLGAVRIFEESDGRLHIGNSFYVEIQPTAPRVDPGAMKVNGLDLERLKRDGKSLKEAMSGLAAWVRDGTVEGSEPVFVGHNAPFDWSFVNYAYHSLGIPNPFGYKALDSKALAGGVLGLHWLDTNKERLESLIGLPPPKQALVHRADYDAWYQAQILVRLLERSMGARWIDQSGVPGGGT